MIATLGFALIVLLIFFGVTVRLPEIRRVSGVLSSPVPAVSVLAPNTGLITQVYVEVGNEVEAGQVLAQIRNANALNLNAGDTQLAIAHLRDTWNFKNQTNNLRLEEIGGQQAFLLEIDLPNREQDLVVAMQQLEIREGEAIEAAEIVSEQEALLLNGLISESTYRGYQRTLASSLEQVRAIEARIREIETQIVQIPRQIEELSLEAARIRLSQAEADANLQRDIASYSEPQFYDVIAPVAGMLLTDSANFGETASINQSLFVIQPAFSSLEVTFPIPSRALASIDKGSDIRVEVSAFPKKDFGLIDTVVGSIALQPLQSSSAIIGQRSATTNAPDAQFEGKAPLPSDEIKQLTDGFGLRPGMSATVYLIITNKTFWQRNIEPGLNKFLDLF